MLRRVILISSVLGAVSAAGALAFASERSRFGRVLTGLAVWSGRGFTPVPASVENAHGAAASLLRQGTDSGAGAYCRFPENGETRTSAPKSGGRPSASDSDLVLEGQSAIPGTAPAAICVGEPAPAVTPNPAIIR